MDWIRVTVKTTTEGADVISTILQDYSEGGVIIEDINDILNIKRPHGEWDYIDEHITDGMDENVYVRGFMNDDEAAQTAVAEIKDRVNGAKANNPRFPWGSLEVVAEKIKDENWSENWKKYYKPFKAGKYIVIKPSWEEYTAQAGELVLEMDPGVAFGTGSHETTRLCIQMLEKYVFAGADVMDIGCGTGVLAMCASLLGAKSVHAIDIDSSAVKVARDNAENGGFKNIDVECGNLLENRYESVDVVVANIIADAVIKLAPAARLHLRENGRYIVSGIIKERGDEVEASIRALGFILLERITDGEWTCMVFER